MTHDPTLVADLARVAAAELDWDWQTNPTPVACLSPTVEAMLDRLVELGWLPPIPPGAMAAAIGPCAYCERDGVKVHREVAGGVCTDERACWRAYTAQDAE